MRRFALPALLCLLLAACAPMETPQPGVVRYQAAAATEQPNLILTAAVAQAAAEVQAAQTATAERNAIATRTETAAETQAAGTAMYAASGATQTAAAISVTLQAVSGAYATGTFQAGAATQTATAAIPAGTATRAVELAREAEQSRGSLVWLLVGVALTAGVVVLLALAGNAYIRSLGVKREKEAEAALIKAKSDADAALIKAKSDAENNRMLAVKDSTEVRREGNFIIVIVDGKFNDIRKVKDDPWVIESQPRELSPGAPDEQPHHAPARAGAYPDQNADAIAMLDEHFQLPKEAGWPVDRISGWREFRDAGVERFDSAEAWTRVIRSLGNAVYTKSGNGGGTFVTAVPGRNRVAHLYRDLKQGVLTCRPPVAVEQ